MVSNSAVKRKLGFSDVQPFDTAMMDAVSRVASTAYGDDCGESFSDSPWTWSIFAHLHDPAVRSMFLFANSADLLQIGSH